MTGSINNIDGLARTSLIRPNEQRGIKRRQLDQIDLDDITHPVTLIVEHHELSLMIEQDVIVNSAVTQPCFGMSILEVACRYLPSYVFLDSAAKSKDAPVADRNSLQAIVVLAIGLYKTFGQSIS